MRVFRSPRNPIITPQQVKPSIPGFKVDGVFNAGVVRHNDKVLLLLRVAESPVAEDPNVCLAPIYDSVKQAITTKGFRKDDPGVDFSDPRVVRVGQKLYLTSISHLRVAVSKNGIDFIIEDAPAISAENMCDSYGVEDPRITDINGIYYITFTTSCDLGVTISLARTQDFRNYSRVGVIFPPDNKDVMIFPQKINEKYYALHRPTSAEYQRREMWIAESPDLLHWGNYRFVMGVRENSWEAARIGGGTVPVKLDEGWLVIYHGANDANRYCLGAVLLDGDKPWEVIGRTEAPIMEPDKDYELKGYFPNAIFTCGALYEGRKVRLYYGAADAVMCYAEMEVDDILAELSQQSAVGAVSI